VDQSSEYKGAFLAHTSMEFPSANNISEENKKVNEAPDPLSIPCPGSLNSN